MAGNIKINHAGAKQLLQSADVMRELRKIGDSIANSTGEPTEYSVDEFVGRNRARVSVSTDTNKARRAEATDHTLIRAVGRGGHG